ncbi:MAG: GTPase HflX [Gammaproteobacteria bacterium]|nr:GTPase HflX [Gammaproteobacteria bacterium]
MRKQRALSRRARRKAIVPTVALVGYTNAGKSTLFNRLTGADIYAADQLFATLDPTLRRLNIPEFGAIILADTVGFIRHLPPDLIEAFHATLEEVSEADLLLHIVDYNDEKRADHMAEVDQVLDEIGAHDVPRLIIYNKIDLNERIQPKLDLDELGKPRRVFISATENLGINLLVEGIAAALGNELISTSVSLTPEQSQLRANLYKMNAVQTETIDAQGNSLLEIRLRRVEFERLFR